MLTLPATEIYLFMMVFARVGAMTMMFPVFGEVSVSPRLRLSIALVLTLLMLPIVSHFYPPLPSGLGPLLGLLFGELFVGFLIGSVGRIVMSALQIAGNAISMQTGLSFAQNFDPTQGIQGAIVGTFLSLIAVTLIVATNLHHLLLGAMAGSYTDFAPGALPQLNDSFVLILDTIAAVFALGLKLAAPFIVFGLVFYLSMGVLAKLMPQVQVFFIVTPASILLGFALLMILMGTLMTVFLGAFEDNLLPFAR